jgi:tRNA(Ile)-lysidine synthase
VHPKLLEFVRKHGLISPGDRLGVAVSAGADSVALLRALLELRPQLGCILSVVHLHHSLRGDQADADAAFVQHLAAQHDLEFHCRQTDVAALASSLQLSLEAAGRRARIDFFAELNRRGVVDRVATAHTADDQAETVLLKFLRGAGTRGLAGVYPASEQLSSDGHPVTIVRPLLAVTRAEVEQYLRAIDQPWREDASNASPEFLRNRVRHELLPLLAREFNPNIRESLSTAADIARVEQDFWDSTISRAIPALEAGTSDAQAIASQNIDVSRFLSTHPAVQRRVLKALAPCELDFAHIEQAREFILASQTGDRELARGIHIRLQRSSTGEHSFSFIVAADSPDNSYSVQLSLPGQVLLPARASRLVARLADHAAYGTALEASLAGRTLTIRNWRAGDRFQPTGRGSSKLKDLFQQIHVPAAARQSWPVAELDGEIVWVLGLPVASRFVASGSSALVIEEFKAQ